MIRCRTLGPVEITIDGRAAPPELLWRRHLALLVYLVRSPKRARTRDHLIGLLWPDKPEQAARHSLREAVRILRRCLGEEAVETTGQQVRLCTTEMELDVDLLEKRAASADWEGAAELIAGEFMEGFGVPGTTGLEDWLGTERLHWRQRAIEVLAQFADRLSRGGRNLEAADAARRALTLDPLSDVAARLAMRGATLLGDRHGALEVFETFRGRLQSSTGAVPQAETEHLAERIRAERLPAGPARGPQPSGAESRRAPLVGRSATFESLCAHWESVRQGQGAALVVLEGDLGFGKSRLMEELVTRARLDGATVSVVRLVEADDGEPHAGLLGLASGGLGNASGVTGSKSQSIAAFAAELPEWADRFPAVSGEQPQALPRAFRDVVAAAAVEGPVVLAVDDAHWLDTQSLQALEAVLRDLRDGPVMVILTVTSYSAIDAIDRLRSQIGREMRGATVTLEPLSPEDIRALARWALPDYSVDQIERVSRRVAVDSAGLPLLAVELFHAIALGLDLAATSGAWPAPLRTLDETLPGDLPGAVVAAIRVGYRRLSVEAREVLAAASVLGERFDHATLEQATELPVATVVAALDELEWQRWIDAEPRGYTFVARLVRAVITRDMLTAGQRRRILERVAS